MIKNKSRGVNEVNFKSPINEVPEVWIPLFYVVLITHLPMKKCPLRMWTTHVGKGGSY